LPQIFLEPAKKALSSIKDIEGSGKVPILHVVMTGETHGDIASNILEAPKKPGEIKTDLTGAGLSVKIHIRLGRPPDEIISLADAEDISLILMSSHGKGLLTELLFGSTTLGVAIHTNRNLMVIRTPGKPRNYERARSIYLVEQFRTLSLSFTGFPWDWQHVLNAFLIAALGSLASIVLPCQCKLRNTAEEGGYSGILSKKNYLIRITRLW
jgi:nucleotide-binding universal stress UspA family protein